MLLGSHGPKVLFLLFKHYSDIWEKTIPWRRAAKRRWSSLRKNGNGCCSTSQPGGREARVNEQRPSTKQLASAGARGACSEAVRGLPCLAPLELQLVICRKPAWSPSCREWVIKQKHPGSRLRCTSRLSGEVLQVTETNETLGNYTVKPHWLVGLAVDGD